MNILLVVPFYDNLPLLSSEAETIVNLLKPRRVLQGNVTEDRLRSAIQDDIRDGGPFMGVWFATHSSERALELSDVTISRDALVQYVALSGAQWVVVNGCESEGLAAGIAAIGVNVLAVAMTEDSHGIVDRDAWRAAVLVASALQQNEGDLAAAFKSVPNLNTHHRFFPAALVPRSFSSGDQQIFQMLYELKAELARQGEQISGIKADIAELKSDRPKVKASPTSTTVAMMIAIMAFVSVIGLVAYLSIRG